jgi:hypothetical protein
MSGKSNYRDKLDRRQVRARLRNGDNMNLNRTPINVSPKIYFSKSVVKNSVVFNKLKTNRQQSNLKSQKDILHEKFYGGNTKRRVLFKLYGMSSAIRIDRSQSRVSAPAPIGLRTIFSPQPNGGDTPISSVSGNPNPPQIPGLSSTPGISGTSHTGLITSFGTGSGQNPGLGFNRRQACYRGLVINVDNTGTITASATTGSTTNNLNLLTLLSNANQIPTTAGIHEFVFEFFGWRRKANNLLLKGWINDDSKFDIYRNAEEPFYTIGES